MSEAKRILKELKREVNSIPSSDYRLNSEPAEKPNGLLVGGLKLVDEFAKASFVKVPEAREKHLVLVNPDVQLYVCDDDRKVNSVGMALFPIFEPKFVGMGNIYMGAYESKIGEGSNLRQLKIREANLYFLRRDDPESGFTILIKEAKHKDRRYSAIYKIGEGYSDLIQFGVSDKGFFVPKPSSDRMGLVSFDEEDPTFYGGAGTIDIKRYTSEIKHGFDYLKRMVKDYGLDFKDEWEQNGTIKLNEKN